MSVPPPPRVEGGSELAVPIADQERELLGATIAERLIETLRRECLDHLLIAGPRHLAVVLQEFVEHYNGHRPHRSLDQHQPAASTFLPCGAVIRPL
jgi:Integrase core domain